ncbi:MAG: DUF2207 domain-containing protein [Anaerolineaceae bacterium]|nr:DUF2207 domain-containing protein [Anaerolineaceae bacterium]
MRQIRQLLFLIGLFGLVAMTVPGYRALAQADVAYERFDVNITVLADGRFTVQEIQQIRFDGEFTTGFAEIPLAYTTSIEEVLVTGGPSLAEQTAYRQGAGPESYALSREGETLFVDWEFAATSPGDVLVFVLTYTVEGGLWVYPEANRLEWRAIPADRSGLVVPQSRVSVTLPTAVAAEALFAEAFGPAYAVEIADRGGSTTVVYEASEAVADGTAFQVLLDFPPELVTAVPQPWQITEDSAQLEYSIDQIDMTIEVQPDGTLYVLETQQVSVQAGVLYSGYRRFSLLFTDDIQIVNVFEGEFPFTEAEPGSNCVDCYTVETEPSFSWWASYSPADDEVAIYEEAAGEVRLNWFIPPLVAGESGQFTLEYLVAGAVLPRTDDQQLNWTAVANYGVPIENVQVRWLLPNGLGLEDVQVSGGDVSRAADGAVLVTNTAPIAPNSPWQIELTLPPDGTDARTPAWQRKIEAEVAEGEAFKVRQARIDLAWLVGQMVAGVTAVLGAITYWYLRGSRRLREAMGNYRTEPPSNLPPGVVNYLVEGKMTARGVLASVLHLADLGLVQLQMGGSLLVTAVRQEPLAANGTFITPAGQEVTVSRFLLQLFNQLLHILPPGEAVPLPKLLETLPSHLPQLTKTMAEEMVGYFYDSGSVWSKSKPLINVIASFAVLGLLVLVFGRGLQDQWGVPIPAFFVGAMFLWLVIAQRSARGGPTLTDQADAEVKKWQGFKAYLAEIQQYGDLAEAQEILDHYFAYAVALGVDDRLLAHIQQLGGHIPSWWHDGSTARPLPSTRRTWRDRWRRQLRRGSWRPFPSRPVHPAATTPTLPKPAPAAGNGRPPLETISDNLAGGLERASTGLAELLNTAVGPSKEGSPTDIVLHAAGQSVKLDWDGNQSLDGMMNDIMSKARTIRPPRPSSGGGSGGYSGGSGGGRSSFGRSSSRSSSSRSSSSRSRSSSSRRSGGGGRRGFR